MKNNNKDYSHIKGWGVDADPNNDPTYPIKHRIDEEREGDTWKRPTQQTIDIEVLHSIERPNVTAVFGTSMPPKGLSGMIRRYAFKHSESSYTHWLSLIMADRVNVVEGVIDDLANGHLPNIFAEKGGNADWKYNRKAVYQKMAVVAGLSVAAVFLINKKSKNKASEKSLLSKLLSEVVRHK